LAVTSTAAEHRGIEMYPGDHICALDHRIEHSAGPTAQLDLLTPWDTYLKSGQFSSGEFLAEG
jgi:hypothetical protein